MAHINLRRKRWEGAPVGRQRCLVCSCCATPGVYVQRYIPWEMPPPPVCIHDKRNGVRSQARDEDGAVAGIHARAAFRKLLK
jgi:hypothetical protein